MLNKVMNGNLFVITLSKESSNLKECINLFFLL